MTRVGPLACSILIWWGFGSVCSWPIAALAVPGIVAEECPDGAIAIEPGISIQAAVDKAAVGAAFCLKNGIHRMQVVRPKRGQKFYGEGDTVLNGSRLLAAFTREGRFWVASGQDQQGEHRGECLKTAPTCDLSESLFIDDKLLIPATSKAALAPGQFWLDHSSQQLYLVDDPAGRKVEATVAPVAFESTAPDVLIRNITIEKYANGAQIGAIQTRGAVGWIIENCEVRMTDGAGIGVGTGGRVRGSSIHHNGQMGIGGNGQNIIVEDNDIWANNTRGFNFKWEAGGVKFAQSADVIFRRNHVHDNIGPGIWCDIGCHDILYEDNIVDRNYDAGIFHEISFAAVIRKNVVRHNGIGDRSWFWGADILVAASQDVQVYDNAVTVSAGGCGIVLIDQGRLMEDGEKYKTRNNKVLENRMTFEGAGCAGGASDTAPGNENFSIITDGHNVFDRNLYRVPRGVEASRFVWGHTTYDWEGARDRGFEPNGRLLTF